jgi:hypothetical protein
MRQSPLLPLLSLLALCVSAFAAQSVIGEDNQAITGLSTLPLANKLHSRPGATFTFYLDFTGAHPFKNTPWSGGAEKQIPKYAGTDKNIQNIWRRVSDAFAPFDVDVTTEWPFPDKYVPAHTTNFQRCIIGGNPFQVTDPVGVPAGTVESQGWWTGGTSYSNSLPNNATLFGAYEEVPCFVFPDPPFALTEMEVAGAISHQLGHTLGLKHKGVVNTSAISSEWHRGHASRDGMFYFGHGAEDSIDSWGPIMGLPVYGQNRQSWVASWYATPTLTTISLGTIGTQYTLVDNSSNTDDELALISTALGYAQNAQPAGGAFIPGGSVGKTTSLAVAGGTFLHGTDSHSFSFMANPGPITMRVETIPATGALGPVDTKIVSNLRVSISLSDEHGYILYKDTKGTYPDQGVQFQFTARKSGIYQVTLTPWSAQDVIDSYGNPYPYGGGPYPASPIILINATPNPGGNQGKTWDVYGSVGKYALVGTWTGPTYLSPTSDMTVSSSSITFNSAVNFSGTASDPNIGNSGLFTYVWDFGDPLSLTNSVTQTNVATSNVSHTYKAPGVYTARLIVTDSFGKSSVAATKVITVTGSLPPAIKIDAPLVASWRIATNVERSANVSLRVVDQYGQSVVGALVSVNVVNGTATAKIGAKTDGQGNFTYAMPKQLNSKPGDFTFTITGVTPVKAGATYSPTAGKTGVTLRSNGTTVQF